MNKCAVILEEFNISLSAIDRTARHQISKNAGELSTITNQQNITDMYRTLHATTAEYTFFPSAHGTITKIDHSMGLKGNFNKFKRIETIQNMFSDHNEIKLEINNRKISKH